jgi:CheY-like chemotaxis protein
MRRIRPTLMVVEDDPFARELVRHALDGDAWGMVFAVDGGDALALLRRGRSDLILMDVRLPGLDAVALTQRLKAVPHLAYIPVVTMMGNAGKQALMDSLQAGATDFVVNPSPGSRSRPSPRPPWRCEPAAPQGRGQSTHAVHEHARGAGGR